MRTYNPWLKLSFPLVFSMLVSCEDYSPQVTESVASIDIEQFKNPPASAKPRLWWHWMNGNVTQDGIDKDLEWMHRVGIGGLQNFDAELMAPQIVEQRISYMSPEWAKLFGHAVEKATSLDIEFGIAASPGWSETGGPWVDAKDGLKKVVWSSVNVDGGVPVGSLPSPPKSTGAFQDFGHLPGIGPIQHPENEPQFYADIGVYAFPVSTPFKMPAGKLSASSKIDTNALIDGSLLTSVDITNDGDQSPWLRLDYPISQTIAAVSLGMQPGNMFFGALASPVLEGSIDGQHFEKITAIPGGSTPQYTVSFEPRELKSIRIVFNPPTKGFTLPSSSAEGAVMGLPSNLGKTNVVAKVLEIAVSASPMVHRFEEKAGFGIADDYYQLASDFNASGVAPNQVMDVTPFLQKDGRLNWTPPAGQWRIVRIGYSLLGTTNHPAVPEATGLEVDKYDPDAVRQYINEYIDNYANAIGNERIGKGGISNILNDSIEVGASNWTPNLPAEFRKRRGYDIAPWMPALTGVIIENAEKTDAFLYDFRQTLADMLAENHYGVITEELHKRGITHYSEALESGRPSLGDDMKMRKTADIPMAAMWTFDTNKRIGPMPQYWADIRGAASVAHVYGKPLVAAESLTAAASPWAFSPRDFQPMIDMEFALGVNRPVLHSSVHQPLDDKQPGMSLWIFGHYFNRHETWAEFAKPWVSYLARNAFMLQQGVNVADVAYFIGEEGPLTALYGEQSHMDAPKNNGFDYINPDMLLNDLHAEEGMLVSSGGARYQVLYLGGSSHKMSVEVLSKLTSLMQGGIKIIGKKPESSPRLMDNTEEFNQLVNAIWSEKNMGSKVFAVDDIQQGMSMATISADYKVLGADDAVLMFVHRKTANEEIYFYTNRLAREEPLELVFNIAGRVPTRWDADSGMASPVSYRVEHGKTIIPRTLKAFESGFIVFGDKTDKTSFTQPESKRVALVNLDGEWKVEFQAGRGIEHTQQNLDLGDWSKNASTDIRYFSGTANYVKTVNLTTEQLQSEAIELDLGQVDVLAEVSINGQSAGITWKPPYTVNVGKWLKPGENTIEVAVTNLWVNRLIGDQQPGAKPITYASVATYRPDAPLRSSGLIGPVKLIAFE